MDKQLKLYVWEMADYPAGTIFALAASPKEAREVIRESVITSCGYVSHSVDSGLKEEPAVYDSPVGFTIWGVG